jgi:mRNA-degrading endonuclease YafQ of YafQ-DinJ toxin-antitoxin module
MIEILYAPSFVRQFQTLEKNLAEEALEKIELFKNRKNHNQLKVHKLKGPFRGRYAFSVNYRVRILFEYPLKSRKEILMLAIDDHDIYK